MRRFVKRIASLAALALLALSPPAWAGERPVTVELFTSQSCYSCPPAEAFLNELAGMEDVVALEFHVDYWDRIVYGGAGQWKDVFSQPAWTERQYAYARRITRSGRVYTPQMVVGGRAETVGSRRGEVLDAIEAARRADRPGVDVAVRAAEAGGLAVSLSGEAEGPAQVWLVRFQRRHETRVLGGENNGKTLVNAHAVLGIEAIGEWRGAAEEIAISDPGLAAGEGCAVLVQAENAEPVLGADYCPLPES
jgi:hypothetical protein